MSFGRACITLGALVAFGIPASTGAGGPRLGPVPYPGGRAPSTAVVELGRELFFDVRLSSDNTVACATCHKPELGFADGKRLSAGVPGTPLKRHTPHLYNLAWARSFFWDGRATSLEEQALQPIRNPDEMALPGDAAALKLQGIPSYSKAFANAFPTSGISMKNIAASLAAFERTLVSKDSPADRYEAGEASALTTVLFGAERSFSDAPNARRVTLARTSPTASFTTRVCSATTSGGLRSTASASSRCGPTHFFRCDGRSKHRACGTSP